MKEILILSSKNYPNSESINYGDCILINTGFELVIYDCGSESHADKVIDYMNKNNFDSAKLILSHNDSDHFDGINKLLKEKKLTEIRTTLLLKYKDDILERIDDKRKTRDSVSRHIIELYNNISKLSGANLVDIYENTNPLNTEVSIVGPDKDYMLDTVAKRLDGREGDTMDGETAVNATSIQVKIKIDDYTLLFCGDCSYAAIEDKIYDYDAVQLPHHGKQKQAEKIFLKKSDQFNTIYIVSDNTGNTNGGSDNLNTRGHRVLNTKNSPDICITSSSFNLSKVKTGKTLGK
ncbi:MBL fold metallo-hydrolase [Clostridium perfringens]|uniref:MBL fold metallo-hydrolase n=1 Tax=Clostridium perfringens TaxID=1502 RepID=UPI001CC80900|nr:MBL fold metallo-hydrolase [Clostridium perfringens]CAG9357923.1 metallo-beta-lactamase domain-containing protein [Clostridium perfringens]